MTAAVLSTETLTFDSATLPSPWQEWPSNYGKRDFANQRMNAYSTDAMHRIFRTLTMPSGASQLEVIFTGNTDASSRIGGSNNVYLTLANGNYYQIAHGYGNTSAAGQMNADIYKIVGSTSTRLDRRSQTRASGVYTYTITVQNGSIAYRGVSSTGAVAFDFSISDSTLTLSGINRIDLGLYVTTTMSLWADDLTVRISDGGAAVNLPTVTTAAATNVTPTSATLGGNVTSDGGASVTQRGVVYGAAQNPTTGNATFVTSGTGTGSFSVNTGTLTAGTTYYARAFATNSAGTAYGSQVTFVTQAAFNPPSVTTNGATQITSTSAQVNATVNPNGVSTNAYFSYGPTARYGSTTSITNLGSGSAALPFTASVTNLTPNTTYHYSVTAINSSDQSNSGLDLTFTTAAATVAPSAKTDPADQITTTSANMNGTVNPNGTKTSAYFQYGPTTSYGSTTTPIELGSGTAPQGVEAAWTGLTPGATYHYQIVATNTSGQQTPGGDQSFTALKQTTVPTLTTNEAADIKTTSATLGGNVSADGGATVMQRGVVYSTAPNPTTGNATSVTNGTGTGSFTVSSGPLKSGTTYYARAFATNSAGTGYGNSVQFTTLPDLSEKLPTIMTNPPELFSNDGRTFTATFKASVNPSGSPMTLFFRWGTKLDGSGLPIKETGSSGTDFPVGPFSGSTSQGVSSKDTIDLFTSGSKYFVRAWGKSSDGTVTWDRNQTPISFAPGALSVATSTPNGQSVGIDPDQRVIASYSTQLTNGVLKFLGGFIVLAGFETGFAIGAPGVASFSLQESKSSGLIDGRTVAAAGQSQYTVTTDFSNGLLSGTISGPGISPIAFSCKPDATGPTASLAGLYTARSLDGNIQIRTIVGGSGTAYSLITTPFGTEVASSIVDAYGNFSATTARGTSVNLGLSNTGINGNLLSADSSQLVAFVGTASSSVAPGRLANLSARAFIQGAQSPLVAGVVTNGSLSKSLLIRGVGPGLAGFGLSNYLANPQLTLYDSKGAVLSLTTSWSSSLGPTFTRLGAFALSPGSSDAATLVTLPTGGFTAQIASGISSGVVIAEIYDADGATTASRLINLSARGFVGTSSQALVAGLVIGGAASETILVRAVGPGLGAFGLGGVCPSPVLTVFNASGSVIASNAGWENSIIPSDGAVSSGPNATIIQPATAGVFSSVGAFALTNGSADSAMVVTLPPGSYTLQVTPATTTGVGLVEIYEMP